MENKIDQFFKDKLEGHTLPPSEEAWAKVEANLSKKNNVAIWRIAAAILIAGALISVIIWSQLDNKNNEQILATKKSNKDSMKEKSAPQISSVEKKKEVRPSNTKKSPNALPQLALSHNDSQKKNEETLTPSIVIEKEQTVAVVKENIQEEKEIINTKATPPTTIASTKQKPIKLEFTLDDISSEQPVATAGEEKSTGLKKVWNLAREVKNGDGPVHEIKNEIFALNFKKNKNQ
ncbi:MAG TPA: hypothetical protein VGQ59_15690 [Cyclobacteriaceae bacterium]|jgi:hypothetical protein|nr:hypothetical protein [Cyclobacteriaceae bacterium]